MRWNENAIKLATAAVTWAHTRCAELLDRSGEFRLFEVGGLKDQLDTIGMKLQHIKPRFSDGDFTQAEFELMKECLDSYRQNLLMKSEEEVEATSLVEKAYRGDVNREVDDLIQKLDRGDGWTQMA